MSELKDSGDRRTFGTGAVRDVTGGKGRFDLVPLDAVWELAKVLERGAAKYDERNWEKGIPISSCVDSMLRHTTQFMSGATDENHLQAILFNATALVTMMLRAEELGVDNVVDVPRVREAWFPVAEAELKFELPEDKDGLRKRVADLAKELMHDWRTDAFPKGGRFQVMTIEGEIEVCYLEGNMPIVMSTRKPLLGVVAWRPLAEVASTEAPSNGGTNYNRVR